MKERVIVAETLMRRLYNRNKDIETYHKQKVAQYERRDAKGLSPSPIKPQSHSEMAVEEEPESELDMIAKFKEREEAL